MRSFSNAYSLVRRPLLSSASSDFGQTQSFLAGLHIIAGFVLRLKSLLIGIANVFSDLLDLVLGKFLGQVYDEVSLRNELGVLQHVVGIHFVFGAELVGSLCEDGTAFQAQSFLAGLHIVAGFVLGLESIDVSLANVVSDLLNLILGKFLGQFYDDIRVLSELGVLQHFVGVMFILGAVLVFFVG